MKCVIVDDQRSARDVLRHYLSKYKDIEIVGEAADVKTAVKIIRRTKPDLLFLDVKLPDGDGFSILEKLRDTPRVIFTTGHALYAARAFEVNALDYITKPYNPQRLEKAVARARAGEKIGSPTDILKEDDRLLLRNGAEHKLIDVGSIVLIVADREYTHIRDKEGREFVEKKPMKYWTEHLSSNFISLDRSRVINLHCIGTVKPSAMGGTELQLTGVSLPIHLGRAASARLRLACPHL